MLFIQAVRFLFPSLFSGNGQLIRPSDLTLGGCAALDAAAVDADRVLQFQTELPGCSSTLTVCSFSVHLLWTFYSCCKLLYVSLR